MRMYYSMYVRVCLRVCERLSKSVALGGSGVSVQGRHATGQISLLPARPPLPTYKEACNLRTTWCLQMREEGLFVLCVPLVAKRRNHILVKPMHGMVYRMDSLILLFAAMRRFKRTAGADGLRLSCVLTGRMCTVTCAFVGARRCDTLVCMVDGQVLLRLLGGVDVGGLWSEEDQERPRVRASVCECLCE